MTDKDNISRTGRPGTIPLKSDTPISASTGPRPLEISRPTHEPHNIANPSRLSSPEGKKLIVGREIELSGNISACDRLIIEGRVEAELEDCREIEIAATGMFKGAASIETAEVSGRFDGNLTAREILIVRSTGRVTGSIRFGKLEIERGGEVVGDIGLCDEKTGS